MELMCGRPFRNGQAPGTGLRGGDVADVRKKMSTIAAPHDAAHLIAVLAATRSFATRDWREEEHGSPMADEHVIATLISRPSAAPLDDHPGSSDILDDLARLLALGLQAATISLYCDLDSGLGEATAEQQLAARFRGSDAMVRGDAYEPQELPLVLALFADEAIRSALRDALGFDAEAAVGFEQAITRILERRFVVNGLGEASALRRLSLVKNLSVTPSLLARSAGRSLDEATSFLEQLSIGFGHRERGGALMGGSSQIRLRPLVAVGDGRYIPTSAVNLMAALRPRLEASLKGSPVWERYQANRAALVEQRTEMVLRHALDPDETWRNVGYDITGTGSGFETDILLLVDDTLLVIEVKAGEFSESARKGRARALADELKEIIGKAATQAMRLEIALIDRQYATFYDRNTHAPLRIPLDRVRRVFPIVVTLRPVGWLQGTHDLLRAAGILPAEATRAPWIVGLHELELIAYLTEYPSQLTRFIALRLGSRALFVGSEELNLWMLYLRRSLEGVPNGVPIMVPNETQDLDTFVMFRNVARPKMDLSDTTHANLRALQKRRHNGWLGTGEALVAQEQRDRRPFLGAVQDLAAEALAG